MWPQIMMIYEIKIVLDAPLQSTVEFNFVFIVYFIYK